MEEESKAVGCVLWVLGIGMAILIASLFIGCTTTKYVPVTHTEYRSRTDTIHQKDSIYLHDSVWVNQYMKGDTLIREINKTTNYYNSHYYNQSKADTLRDSIPVPYPVEKPQSAKDKFFIKLGNLLLWAVGIILFAVVGYVIYRLYCLVKSKRKSTV